MDTQADDEHGYYSDDQEETPIHPLGAFLRTDATLKMRQEEARQGRAPHDKARAAAKESVLRWASEQEGIEAGVVLATPNGALLRAGYAPGPPKPVTVERAREMAAQISLEAILSDDDLLRLPLREAFVRVAATALDATCAPAETQRKLTLQAIKAVPEGVRPSTAPPDVMDAADDFMRHGAALTAVTEECRPWLELARQAHDIDAAAAFLKDVPNKRALLRRSQGRSQVIELKEAVKVGPLSLNAVKRTHLAAAADEVSADHPAVDERVMFSNPEGARKALQAMVDCVVRDCLQGKRQRSSRVVLKDAPLSEAERKRRSRARKRERAAAALADFAQYTHTPKAKIPKDQVEAAKRLRW